MKKALILGCGPSGLLAAHAARLNGWRPIVVSLKRPSPLFGCQYLHDHIPGLTEAWSSRRKEVNYVLHGDAESYGRKVYGEEYRPGLRVSPESLVGRHNAWDIRSAYKELWETYGPEVVNARVIPDDIHPLQDFYKPDLFVNTIPMPLLCVNPEHDFRSVKCWAVGDAPELGQYVPRVSPEFTVSCDSSDDVGWYRASNVFGYSTIEWPGWRSKPPVRGVVEFLKPLSTNCDCHPGMERLGRMGEWRKGVLAHEAFQGMWQLMGVMTGEQARASWRRVLGT